MEGPSLAFEYEAVYDYYVIEAWRDLSEPVAAYTPEMVAKHVELLCDRPWVQPVASADDDAVLGRTPGWPDDPAVPGDPAIPPQTLYGYVITATDPTDADVRVILTAGNHGTEFTGNWVLHGTTAFLASDDPRAEYLRRRCAFYVYPDVNPEARYMAVERIDLEGAPDPNAGTNMRKRGNPELYAAGEKDHNRVWNTDGASTTVDTIKRSIEGDIDGDVTYLWDMHGPQTPANWRSPAGRAAWECPYGRALTEREPDVEIAGLPGGFKSGLSFQPGKLPVWAGSEAGLSVTYPYVYEPGGWREDRLLEAGRTLALALYDALDADP